MSIVLNSPEYKSAFEARIQQSEQERTRNQQLRAEGKPSLVGPQYHYTAPWWTKEKGQAIYKFAADHGITHPRANLGYLLEPGIRLIAVYRTVLSEEQVYARILEIELERKERRMNTSEPTTNAPEGKPDQNGATLNETLAEKYTQPETAPAPDVTPLWLTSAAPKAKTAIVLLRDGYPDAFARCECASDVFYELGLMGYTWNETLSLWAQHEPPTAPELPESPAAPDGDQPDEPNYVDGDAIAASLPDEDDDTAHSHALTVGAKIVYCGESLRYPNGHFTVVRGCAGQITDLIADTGAMVIFEGFGDGEISVPLSDLRHYDDGCNRYGEPAHIQRGNLIKLFPGDIVQIANGAKGPVLQLLPGGDAEIAFEGRESTSRVSRSGLVLIERGVDVVRRATELQVTINHLEAEKKRLQQLLQDAQKQADRPAPLPNLGELDMLRAENTRLKARIDALEQPVPDDDIPAGDLFSELRIMHERTARRQATIRHDLTEADLERLLNQGYEPLHLQFMRQNDRLNGVFVRKSPALPQQPTNGTTKTAVRTADDVAYIYTPDEQPEPVLNFRDALRASRDNPIPADVLKHLGDQEVIEKSYAAGSARRQERSESGFRHISDVIALPGFVVSEVRS